MDLLEYQGKQLFARHGIPVPSGEPAGTVDDAVAAANRIGYPCAIKAQVLVGGRGKLGGIKLAADESQAHPRTAFQGVVAGEQAPGIDARNHSYSLVASAVEPTTGHPAIVGMSS